MYHADMVMAVCGLVPLRTSYFGRDMMVEMSNRHTRTPC